MDKELLTWIGNALNFLILVYLIVTNIIINHFDFAQTIVVAFGLFVSIIIQLYNIKNE